MAGNEGRRFWIGQTILCMILLPACEWVAGLEKKALPAPDAQQDPPADLDDASDSLPDPAAESEGAPDSVPDPVEECPADAECCSDQDCPDGCKGTALSCDAVTQQALCGSQHGCSWSGPEEACFGLSPACTDYANQEACTACGCTWSGACGPDGTYAPACSSFSDESTCMLCGCGWGATACTGSTLNCNAFHWSQHECESCGCRWTGTDCEGVGVCSVPEDNSMCVFCGCDWNPPCTGTHHGCETCETVEDCESQEGCYWSVCQDYRCT